MTPEQLISLIENFFALWDLAEYQQYLERLQTSILNIGFSFSQLGYWAIIVLYIAALIVLSITGHFSD